IHALKLAFRHIQRAPAFNSLIIVIIALGIGANTAIYSVLRAVMLRPLPMTEPDRLVRLRENFANGSDETQLNLSPVTWMRWRETNSVFTDIGVATGASYTLTGRGDAEYVPAAIVSANFFSVLGVTPALGRNFLPEEDKPGAPRVVLLSYGFWQRVLGGASDVVGQTITLDGEKRTIVGVMPEHFRHPYRAQIWAPIAIQIDPTRPPGHYLYGAARLKPGVSLVQANAAMRELCARVNQETPDPGNPREAQIVPLQDSLVRDSKPRMFAIMAAAAFVLLIAGANIASLLLAKQIGRATEVSVRAALGASRGSLLLESLAQSFLLALLGSVLGVVLAATLTGPLYALSPMASDTTGNAMREFDTTVRLDGQVLAVTTALTLLVGLGFGLLPALRGTRDDLQLAIKGASRGSTLDRRTSRTLSALVATEIAVAVVLLVGTGLMIKSFNNLTALDWGFETKERLAFTVTFSNQLRPEHADRTAYIDQSLERLRALPGVLSATATTLDLIDLGRNLAAITPQGSTPPEGRGYFLVTHRMVVPGYFKDSGIRILKGRAIDDSDRPDGQKVAVISEKFANFFWPGQDPIGKTVRRARADDPRPPYTVVGVAANIHGVSDPTDGDMPGMWYLSYSQNPSYLSNDVTFVVHSSQPIEALQRQARSELGRIDASIAPYDFNTLERLVEDTRVEDRFGLLLISLFGVLGLILSAIGLYGLLAFQVAHRKREFGVRAALGASARNTMLQVFRHGGSLVVAGLAGGVIVAVLLSRVMQSQLHDVSAVDPLSYLSAAAVLSLAAALACGLPAWRASRVDPMVALRED
ncbi:MAG: ABC transporter permease, partial [Vicinamibacteria bacterium]